MKNLLAGFALGAFALTHAPLFAQEKKPEPTTEQAPETAVQKDSVKKAEPKKEEGKKKVKKGGC